MFQSHLLIFTIDLKHIQMDISVLITVSDPFLPDKEACKTGRYRPDYDFFAGSLAAKPVSSELA